MAFLGHNKLNNRYGSIDPIDNLIPTHDLTLDNTVVQYFGNNPLILIYFENHSSQPWLMHTRAKSESIR